MAHKSNRHLSATTRAEISQKLHEDRERKEAQERAARANRKAQREVLKEIRELQHLEHEQLKHESHGYSPAEKQQIASEISRTERADSAEISARAENRYKHELETRTYKPPHRRNQH